MQHKAKNGGNHPAFVVFVEYSGTEDAVVIFGDRKFKIDETD